MTSFDRSFAGLDRLIADAPPPWWCDLLCHWTPSGISSGGSGLRLAVRNGTLNFYRCGQSVARVSVENGIPKAEIHEKYVLGSEERPEGRYLTLSAGGDLIRRGEVVRRYGGVEMLKKWIARAQTYTGAEKSFVDQLVAANGDIIDLEMGLPASDGVDSAPRMDIVSLERAQDQQLNIVFWEAKLVTDSRLRTSGPVISGTSPEVLQQLQNYVAFFERKGNGNRAQVAQAYRRTAQLLVVFHRQAVSLGNPHSLSNAIMTAARPEVTLHVDAMPRLVVGPPQGKDWSREAWQKHAQRLREAGVTLLDLSASSGTELVQAT
jgi:hypothetical protein